jgi:hypothetical protein
MARVGFDRAKLEDFINDMDCKNPRCKKPMLQVVGRHGKKKIIECQACYWHTEATKREEVMYSKGEEIGNGTD